MTCSQNTEDSSCKVNIMECDSRSTSVTIKCFSKIYLSTLLRTYSGVLRKICGLEAFILNYLRRCSRKCRNFECYNFCVQTKECCNIKFSCPTITTFESQRSVFFH